MGQAVSEGNQAKNSSDLGGEWHPVWRHSCHQIRPESLWREGCIVEVTSERGGLGGGVRLVVTESCRNQR